MRVLIFFFLLLFNFKTFADGLLNIGVASNFYEPIKIIKEKFEKNNRVKLNIISGSSSQLYAQIVNGAPLDIFLSADQKTPQKLDKKFIVNNSQFTYAIGNLTFWTSLKNIEEKNAALFFKKNKINILALANPRFSPYGKASKEFLINIGVWSKYKNKLVLANNIKQVVSFLFSGNAKNGFMSSSDKIKFKNNNRGKFLNVSQARFSAINQDAILLSRGKNKEYSEKFLNFLKSKEIKKIIKSFGYKIKN